MILFAVDTNRIIELDCVQSQTEQRWISLLQREKEQYRTEITYSESTHENVRGRGTPKGADGRLEGVN